MNRDAAIEAGARAAFIREAGESNADLATRTWDNYPAEHHVKRYWRRVVAAALDAAAPHLVGEPVGYDFVSLDNLHATAQEAAAERDGYFASVNGKRRWPVVALVPVEEQT